MKSILFLIKKNYSYGGSNTSKSGVINSAILTAEQLEKYLKVKTDIEICVDGNEVDKFLHKHKPKICVIEALWVTPLKMQELVRLHPKVSFVILIHSEIPFLANEGVAIEWIKEYHFIDHVVVGFNSYETFVDFEKVTGGVNLYLPNIYSDVKYHFTDNALNKEINVGCFGAIRPLKNQLLQAFAAIYFANLYNYKLNLHINSSRQEQGGESVLKNIRALFSATEHKLFEYPWMNRENFLLVVGQMHIGLQVSFNESFNIIAADFTKMGIPIVVSDDIEWMYNSAKANPTSVNDIVHKMAKAIRTPKLFVSNSQKALRKHNKHALNVWKSYLKL